MIRADALSMLHAMQGRLELARRLYSHGRATAEDLGLPGEAAGATHAGGFIEMLAGDPIAAERELRRGYETLERMGERATLSTSAGLLAQALAAQGRAGEAERFLQIADETASQDDVASQGLIRAVRARLLARRGEFAEAERLAQEALALDAPTDDYLEHHDVRVTAVEVRLAAGDRRGAASMLEELLALEVAKGNVVSADHARKQLAELAEENASS